VKETQVVVEGFYRIYYRTSGPVPDPVLHISRQFFINKLLSESGSKLDIALLTSTESKTDFFLVSGTVPPMKCDHIYH
jgi:hypothetical protein